MSGFICRNRVSGSSGVSSLVCFLIKSQTVPNRPKSHSKSNVLTQESELLYPDLLDTCTLDTLIIPVCALSYLTLYFLGPLFNKFPLYLLLVVTQLVFIVREIVSLYIADMGVGFLPLVPIVVCLAASLRIANGQSSHQAWQTRNVFLWFALAAAHQLKLNILMDQDLITIRSERPANIQWTSSFILL